MSAEEPLWLGKENEKKEEQGTTFQTDTSTRDGGPQAGSKCMDSGSEAREAAWNRGADGQTDGRRSSQWERWPPLQGHRRDR